MTANLKVEVSKRTNVLRVPNAGIRFRPTPEVFTALNQPVPPEALAGGGRGGRGGTGQAGARPVVADSQWCAPRQGRGATQTRRSGSSGSSVTAGSTAPTVSVARAGDGGAEAGRGGRGGGGGSGWPRRTLAAAAIPSGRRTGFKAMTPDEQQQFIARLKGRGQDTSAFEAAIAKPGRGEAGRDETPAAGGPTAPPAELGARCPARRSMRFSRLPPVETRACVALH